MESLCSSETSGFSELYGEFENDVLLIAMAVRTSEPRKYDKCEDGDF
jgi:hypothetical protein